MSENGNWMNREEAERCFQAAYDKQTEGSVFEAIELYKKSLELFATAEAYTFLGWAYSMQNRYEDAIIECQKAIALDPDFGNPYNDIGAYLMKLGKDDEAITWLEKAAQAPRYDAHFYAHYNLGKIFEKKGNWFRAFECYSKALDLNPDYTLAKKAMARMQSSMN